MKVKTFSEYFAEEREKLTPSQRSIFDTLRPSLEAAWNASRTESIAIQNNAHQTWLVERKSLNVEIAELREDLKWACDLIMSDHVEFLYDLSVARVVLIRDRHKLNNGSKPV